LNIFISYAFSFLGSLTPGTVNLSVLQSGLDHKSSVAIRMAAAAAIVEYFYAWIAVRFEMLITTSPVIVANMQLITAIVMTTLGLMTILSSPAAGKPKQSTQPNGFVKGLLLGILNPLAIPYWTGATAYFKSQGWIDLSTTIGLHSYLLGVSLGVFSLLVLVAYGARRLAKVMLNSKSMVRKIPGFLMLGLGIFAFTKYFVGLYSMSA
jgi:threonine/homoserine/homoserine lactone efflux protein